MAKIELTIKTTYLPDWGAWEGIREVLQNGKDAEVEHNAPLKVTWYNDTLRVENEGVTLPLKALLLGHTTKLGRYDTIGKFGEGLKLGILALIRSGRNVKIRNGSEVWVPYIERSKTFDEDVLSFEIHKGRAGRNRVRVEIDGVDKETWTNIRWNILFLDPPKKGEMVKTYTGSLLTSERYKGRIYIKGIFVQKDNRLQFGYDLEDGDVDRDRKMIDSWSLRIKTQRILMSAIDKEESLLPKFNEALTLATPETEDINKWNVSEKAANFVTSQFKSEYGDNALPVSNLAESKDIEHLGKKGVVVTQPMNVVLSTVLGDLTLVQEELKKEAIRKYGWHELSGQEKNSLLSAIEMIQEVDSVSLEEVDVVDFRSDTLMGQFCGGKISIAKTHLKDENETLRILIHEVAHRSGADGDHGHIYQVENLWKGVVANLRKRHLEEDPSRP